MDDVKPLRRWEVGYVTFLALVACGELVVAVFYTREAHLAAAALHLARAATGTGAVLLAWKDRALMRKAVVGACLGVLALNYLGGLDQAMLPLDVVLFAGAVAALAYPRKKVALPALAALALAGVGAKAGFERLPDKKRCRFGDKAGLRAGRRRQEKGGGRGERGRGRRRTPAAPARALR